MTQIELGEPARYDPGTAPLVRRVDPAVLRLRAKMVLVAVVILSAGAVAGALPVTLALPQVRSVGRFTENPSVIVAGDLVVSPSRRPGWAWWWREPARRIVCIR